MDSRKQKGQLEFIVVVALVVVAIVAVTIVMRQTTQTPPATGQEQVSKTIKDSILNLIRAGVKEKMLLIYNQGGTIKPTYSVRFGMFDTQVWSACGETSMPDVENEIGAGVLKYLRDNLKDEMEFFGKRVRFDFLKARTDVSILKDRINIKIYLPTTVEGIMIQQPYEVDVASKLYDILDFSKNFVEDQTKSRFFEVATLLSMKHSNPEYEHWVPFTGVATGCGNVLFKTRQELLPGVKDIIRYTVSHVVWNKRPLKLADNPFYPLNSVNGKFYPNLDVTFAYPSAWDSEVNKYFSFSPNPLVIVPKPVASFIPFCMASYSVYYTFRYPVIVMVYDPVMNEYFRFAVMVDIQNSKPGNCSAYAEGKSEFEQLCINEANCKAKITVKDTAGNPVQDAHVTFSICDVGITDENGIVESQIPCLISELHVYKKGYRSYGDIFRSDEIENKEVELQKLKENITVHFKAFPVSGQGDYNNGEFESYTVSCNAVDLTPFNERDVIVFVDFLPLNPNILTGEDTALMFSNFNGTDFVNTINASGLQPVAYNVTASVVDNETGAPIGYVQYENFVLGEDDDEFTIYLPVVENLNFDKQQYIQPSEESKLTALLDSCGVKPVQVNE